MGRSFRNEKGFGPKKHKSGGNYNQRREERQKNRRVKERELDEKVLEFKKDPTSYEYEENYLKFREDKPNGKT